jgi:hypothetical protein
VGRAEQLVRRWAAYFESKSHRWTVGTFFVVGGLAVAGLGFAARDQRTVARTQVLAIGTVSLSLWVAAGLLILAGVAVLSSPFLLRRARRGGGTVVSVEEPENLLQREVARLDDELVVGREILNRCDNDDDAVWEPSPNAATGKEVVDWERRVLLWLPVDWGDDFRGAEAPIHAPSDPTSELAKRVKAKLTVLYDALRNRRQYLYQTDPEALLPPDREYPYKGAP